MPSWTIISTLLPIVGRLPRAIINGSLKDTADGVRNVFYRMGFNDKEIVCLSGAHALGRCHPANSGFDGPWTPTPTTFNNLYFTLLKTVDWKRRDLASPLFQYENDIGTIMMLPSD